MNRLAPILTVLLLLPSVIPSAAGERMLVKGDAALHSFDLTETDCQAKVEIDWNDRAAMFDLVLITPGGAALRGSMPGLEVQKGPVSYRLILRPALASSVGWAGTWKVRLRLLDTHRKRPEVPYTFNVDTGSMLKVELGGLGGVQRSGDEVVLTVAIRLAEGRGEVAIDSCRVSVFLAGGSETLEVSVADDGASPDRRAGDRVLTGRFTWPREGDHAVQATVTGTTADGRPCRREAVKSVEVRPAR